jgi:hypothetical protein
VHFGIVVGGGVGCSYITKLGIFIKKNPNKHLENPKNLRLDVFSSISV